MASARAERIVHEPFEALFDVFGPAAMFIVIGAILQPLFGIVRLLVALFLTALLPHIAAASLVAPAPELSGGRVDLAAYAHLLEDPAGDLAVSDIRRRFAQGMSKPAPTGGIALGYTRSVWWIGVHLPSMPSSAFDRRRIFEVEFPTLDRIDFYAPYAETPIVTGDHRPFFDRQIPHRNFAFWVTSSAQEDNNLVLLRVQSEGTLSAPLTLWSPDAFADASRNSYAAMAIYFGALLALMIFNVFVGFVIRENAYLHYIFLLGGLALGVAGFSGMGYQYVWPHWPTFANLAFPLGYSLCAYGLALFTRSFLGMAYISPLLDRLLVATAWFSVATAMLFPFFYMFAGKLLTAATVSSTVLAVVAGIFCLRRKGAQARLFLLAWSVFLFFGTIFSLRNFGLLPSNFITIYGLQFGSVIAMLLLSFALANRIQEERRAKEAAQADVLRAKQLSIDQLRESEHMLEERVEQRTFELAAANQRLLQSEQRQRDLAQHDALTGLANRSLFSDRLTQSIAAAQRDKTRLALLYLDLDKFKPVNDTHGHSIGDALLTEVARRISGRVRESDTVARIGGDEFVVLLRGIDSTHDAVNVGNSIRTSLNQAFLIEANKLMISCSIGIAIYPDHGNTETELSRRADEAMYRAKKAGRDVVCLVDSTDSD
jgi:diguanylate cyclase (GGDEF)-like protein